MSTSRVLITGVSGYLASRLAAVLQAEPAVEAVIGVDAVAPSPAVRARLGGTEFVRADIRNPTLARVLAGAEVDTVVHLSGTPGPLDEGGRQAHRERDITGTMQLLAAAQRTPSLRRLVVKSTTAVYGSSPYDPALFTEDLPGTLPRSRAAKDAVEIEGHVRGLSRRRPDVTVTILRLASILGPGVDTPLTCYFALPVVPTMLGFDPRLQFCAESDAVEVLRRAAMARHPGTFNVSGEGVLLLSQAIRRAGRLAVPVLPVAATTVGGLLRRVGLPDFSADLVRALEHGRAVDITALRTVFGYVPARSTLQAFDDFVRARIEPVAAAGIADRVERVARGVATGIASGYAASAAPGGRTVDA